MVGHALVALFLLSGDLRLQADGTSELRAGEAPIVAGQNPRPFVAEILTPLVALVYRAPEATFDVGYAPRIYWAHPNPVGRWAPLLLHTVHLSLDDQMTPRFRLLASATGSIGQADYTALPQLLGTVQGALPPIQDVASVSGQASGRGNLSERWKLELGAQGLYWRWLKIPETCLPAGGPTGCLPPQTMTSQASASELANGLFRLNPRHELGFGALFGQAHYSYGLEVFSLGPTVTWKVRLTPGDDLRLMLGLAYVRVGGTTPPGTTPPLGGRGEAVSPIGAFEFQSLVARQNQVFISTVATGGVDFYLDPVIGSAVPRASIEAGVAAVVPPDWLVTLKGGFATPIRTAPLPVAANATPFDETAFTVKLAARRRLSMNFFGEFGALWADRGPALVTPDFHFHQRQLWLYIALTGTTRPIPQAPLLQAPPPK